MIFWTLISENTANGPDGEIEKFVLSRRIPLGFFLAIRCECKLSKVNPGGVGCFDADEDV